MVKIQNFKKKFKSGYRSKGNKMFKTTKRNMFRKYQKKRTYMKNQKMKSRNILKFKNSLGLKSKMKKYISSGLAKNVKIKNYDVSNAKKLSAKVRSVTRNILKIKVDYQLGVNEGFIFYNGSDFTSSDIFNQGYVVEKDKITEMYKRKLYPKVYVRNEQNNFVPTELKDTQMKLVDTKIIIDNYTTKGNVAILSFYKPFYVCYQTTQAFKMLFSEQELPLTFWNDLVTNATYVMGTTTNGVLDTIGIRFGNLQYIRRFANFVVNEVIEVAKRQSGVPLAIALADLNNFKERVSASLVIIVDATTVNQATTYAFRIGTCYDDWPRQRAEGAVGLLIRKFEEVFNLQVGDSRQWTNLNNDTVALRAHVDRVQLDATLVPVLTQFSSMTQGLSDTHKDKTIGLFADMLSFTDATKRHLAIPKYLEEYVTRNNAVDRSYFQKFENLIKDGLIGIRSLKDSQETQYKPQLMGNLHYLVNFGFPANVSLHQTSSMNLMSHVSYLKLIRSNQALIKDFTPEFFDFIKRHLKPMLPLYPFDIK